MAENDITPESDAAGQPDEGTPAGTDAPSPETDWKAEARKWESRAKSNTEAAKRLQELEDAQKTETQRLTERAEQAEKALTEREARLTRLEVAQAKGLTPTQAKRLVGATREELEVDADELLADLGSSGPRRPSGDVGQGPRQTASANDDPASLAAAVQAARGY